MTNSYADRRRAGALREAMVRYWRDYTEANGVPPTVRDATQTFGLSSNSVAHYHLMRLVKAGKLRHVPHAQHAFRLPLRGGA